MAERSFKAEVEDLRLGAGQTFTGEGILALTKALLENGVGYVGGYQGAPISHLMDVLADAQDLLGELNDLEVLRRAIDDQLPGRLADSLPQLHDLLASRSAECWSRWREQARELQRPHCRHGLLADLLGAPASDDQGS